MSKKNSKLISTRLAKDWVIELDTNLEAHRFGVYRSIFKFNIIFEMARDIFYNTN